MSTQDDQLATASKRASKVHDDVCDIHYDHSRMSHDNTCSECQDDHHELQIRFR